MNAKKLPVILLICLCLISAAVAESAVSSPSVQQPTIQIVIKNPTASLETTDPSTTAAPEATEETTVGLVISEVSLEKMPESTAKLFQQLQMLMPVATATPVPAATATLAPGATLSPDASASPSPEPTAAPTVAPVKVDITTIVPEDTVKQIVEKLPETSKIEDLVVTEFIPMTVANYDTTYGDVQAQVITSVKYTQQETVTPLLGVWNGNEMIWFVPDVIVAEDGSLILNFTAEMLALMQDSEPVLMLLSDMRGASEETASEEAVAEEAVAEEAIAAAPVIDEAVTETAAEESEAE